jgi:hypothetical protein
MALIGLGMGPMLSGLTVAAQQSVEPQYIGTARLELPAAPERKVEAGFAS